MGQCSTANGQDRKDNEQRDTANRPDEKAEVQRQTEFEIFSLLGFITYCGPGIHMAFFSVTNFITSNLPCLRSCFCVGSKEIPASNVPPRQSPPTTMPASSCLPLFPSRFARGLFPIPPRQPVSEHVRSSCPAAHPAAHPAPPLSRPSLVQSRLGQSLVLHHPSFVYQKPEVDK